MSSHCRKSSIAQHGGKVPKDRAALEALPGVGRKTANVVLNVAFGEKTIAVDTHIFRVSNRTGLAPGKNVLEVELRLEKKIPEQYLLHAHHWLILHGRYTCIARKPLCPTCVVRDLCRYKEKTKEPSDERVTGATAGVREREGLSIRRSSGGLTLRQAQGEEPTSTSQLANLRRLCRRGAQGGETNGIGGAGLTPGQSLDMAHHALIVGAIQEKEGPAGGAVIAPHLGGAVMTHKGGGAEYCPQLGSRQIRGSRPARHAAAQREWLAARAAAPRPARGRARRTQPVRARQGRARPRQ